MFFEKGLFWLDNDFIGPIQFQAHATNAETMSEEEVRSRYLRLAGLEGEEFEAAFRYSFEDYLFLKAVSENTPAYPDFRVALEAHRAVDAVYRSAASDGAKIEL
jgi:predicted dehydrogenase